MRRAKSVHLNCEEKECSKGCSWMVSLDWNYIAKATHVLDSMRDSKQVVVFLADLLVEVMTEVGIALFLLVHSGY